MTDGGASASVVRSPRDRRNKPPPPDCPTPQLGRRVRSRSDRITKEPPRLRKMRVYPSERPHLPAPRQRMKANTDPTPAAPPADAAAKPPTKKEQIVSLFQA